MCATFELVNRLFKPETDGVRTSAPDSVFRFKPGKEVTAVSAAGLETHVWAGFARREILDWWQQKGGILLDIYADRFAERSEVTGKLIWDIVPPGRVIRALLEKQTGTPLIKIVTRAATPLEYEHFQHPRMPVLEPPIHPRQEILLVKNPDELF